MYTTYTRFKHSDWLFKILQPITMVKKGFVDVYIVGKYS